MRIRHLFILFCIILTSISQLQAVNYGKISGRVIEAKSGKPISGVNVYIENQALGATSDEEGMFVILQIPPGEYAVQAEFIGYKSLKVEGVKVHANRISYVDFQLQESILEGEEVVVVAERPVIEKDIAATSRTVSSKDMESIPSTTIGDVLRTQPGVVSSGGLHFRGGRSGEITYYLDGVPLTNPLFSEINSSEVINRDIISDMQIISGTYSAEYGNAMSGIINITTKEGGDQFKFNIESKSTALGLEKASIDHNRTVLRANLSGPILAKTNFFVSANYDDRDSYLPWGYRTERTIFAKISDRHLKNLKLTAALNLSDGLNKSYSHSYKYIPGQYWYEPYTNSSLIQLGITHTLTNHLFYNLQLYRNTLHYDSGDFDYTDLTPEYRRDENKEFYVQSYVSTYEEDDQTTLGLKGEVLWQANVYNEVKSGFEYRRHEIVRFYINTPYYDDHILDDYKVEPWEASAFIQNKINFSSLILSAGLRFDLTAPSVDYWPSPYDSYYGLTERFTSAEIHSQWSPRLAISYPISAKTVFHFGYGHYFQRPEYQFIFKALSRENSKEVYDVDADGDIDYDDNILMNLRTGNGRYGNPDLKPEKTIAYEFGVSHQLFNDYLINISVYSKNIQNLVGVRTFFAGDSSLSGEIYWETFTAHINEDFAFNNGLEIQLKKMYGKNWFGELNYTYSIAEGASSGPLERVGSEEAIRQSLKFFPLSFDQRHSINANLTLRLNRHEGPSLFGIHWFENFSSSFLFQYGSGLPYTKGIRGATEAYEINNKRLPENWTLDLKVERPIDLGLLDLIPYLEIYNLTDRKNVLYVDSFTGKPDFIEGRTREWAANPLNWAAPRLIYLGLRLYFD